MPRIRRGSAGRAVPRVLASRVIVLCGGPRLRKPRAQRLGDRRSARVAGQPRRAAGTALAVPRRPIPSRAAAAARWPTASCGAALRPERHGAGSPGCPPGCLVLGRLCAAGRSPRAGGTAAGDPPSRPHVAAPRCLAHRQMREQRRGQLAEQRGRQLGEDLGQRRGRAAHPGPWAVRRPAAPPRTCARGAVGSVVSTWPRPIAGRVVSTCDRGAAGRLVSTWASPASGSVVSTWDSALACSVVSTWARPVAGSVVRTLDSALACSVVRICARGRARR